MQTIVSMPENAHKALISHLLPYRQKKEQAAFVFAANFETEEELLFEYKDSYQLAPNDFVVQSAYHIELSDMARAMIIKRAHDLNACLIEFHSHISNEQPAFSGSDMAGFSEFVPHVIWRLKNRPYVAVVVSRPGFDALVWRGPGVLPETLSELRVGMRSLRPNGLSLRQEWF